MNYTNHTLRGFVPSQSNPPCAQCGRSLDPYSELPCNCPMSINDEPRSIEEQLAGLIPYFQEALDDILRTPHRGIPRRADGPDTNSLKTLAIHRFFEGYTEYGDTLSRMTDEDLMLELSQELADAVWYRAEQLRRHDHGQKLQSA